MKARVKSKTWWGVLTLVATVVAQMFGVDISQVDFGSLTVDEILYAVSAVLMAVGVREGKLPLSGLFQTEEEFEAEHFGGVVDG